jgi:glycogen synthase
LKILIVAAEATPFAKVGHVAEVIGSLPSALAKLGHDVRLVIPRYGRISPNKFDLKPVSNQLNIPLKNERTEPVSVLVSSLKEEVPVYLIDFEPCGLGQLIAMRYGSIPVVRKTGGLADTVQDFDPAKGEGNGFSFVEYDQWMLFAAIVRALETYKNREVWHKQMERDMQRDYSWDSSAVEYVKTFQRAIELRQKVESL